VFHALLLMLTFYKFKSGAKNKIYSYFEKMFTPAKISQILESKVYEEVGFDSTFI